MQLFFSPVFLLLFVNDIPWFTIIFIYMNLGFLDAEEHEKQKEKAEEDGENGASD